MSREEAMARAQRLKTLIEEYGIRCSIELQTGRSGGWNGLHPHGNLGHHVASRRSQGLTPFLWLVKAGRSDVPGPLCNGYLGFDGVARLITMDWANHPGAGGPWSVPGATIPQNNGRPYLFGWECEGGYTMADWPRQHRDIMARCFAATLRWMGRDERSHGEHGNPWAVGRKVDRIYYYQHLTEARREIRDVLAGLPPVEEPEGVMVMLCERGDDSPAVGALQVQLAQLGFYKGDIDNQYGSGVAAAVLAMRRSVGSSATNGDRFERYAYAQLQVAMIRHHAGGSPDIRQIAKAAEENHASNVRQHGRLTNLETQHSGDPTAHVPPTVATDIDLSKIGPIRIEGHLSGTIEPSADV